MPYAGIWSLYDMLRVYADKYVALGQDFQELEMLGRTYAGTGAEPAGVVAIPAQEALLSDAEMELLVRLFFRVEKHCKEIGLRVTAEIAAEINSDFSKVESNLPWALVGIRVAELRRCFTAEIRRTKCYMILTGREELYTDDPLAFLTERVLRRFPSVGFDIVEAGKCFATERFTAAVSHLMKVAEYSYVSFVRYSKLDPSMEKNWNKGLNDIHDRIRNKLDPYNHISDLDEQYFVGLEGYLRTVKTAWRNPASHIPIVFVENQARTMFEVVKTLMDSASERLSEVVLQSPNDTNAQGKTA
jgi:hypothetical protein